MAQQAAGVVPARSTSIGRFAAQAEPLLLIGVEAAAAMLMALETVILLAGVVARYVFQSPLVW